MNSGKQKAIIFNDGSLAFRLYQKEYSGTYDFQVIKVSGKPTDVSDWILDSDIDFRPDSDSDIPVKIHLHFLYDDFIANKEELRGIVGNLQMSYLYRNRIFLPYEGLDLPTATQRAKEKGINIEDKPFVYVGTKSVEQIQKMKESLKPGVPIIIKEDNKKDNEKYNWKDKSTGPKAKRKVSKL